jgi:hypothetical protein
VSLWYDRWLEGVPLASCVPFVNIMDVDKQLRLSLYMYIFEIFDMAAASSLVWEKKHISIRNIVLVTWQRPPLEFVKLEVDGSSRQDRY